MRTEKIGLREFLFHRKVPGIGDGRCICRQGNQTVKHVLLECRLYNQMRRGLWTEESKKAREVFRPGAHSYGWALRKESSDFHEGDGADWPV